MSKKGAKEEQRMGKGLEKDEYRINISQNGITIYANDYGGCFYAIITLIHLISYYDYKLPLGEIEDRPYFEWRGMHLDCSRQFHTVEQIKRLLIYMGMFIFVSLAVGLGPFWYALHRARNFEH